MEARPDSQSVSEKPRKRRQRADDLVPAGCGLTREDIVCLPIDDFNDKVAEKSEKEIVVLKDRRRRGKNRVSPYYIRHLDSPEIYKTNLLATISPTFRHAKARP